MIDIPDLGDDLHRMWEELIILGETAPVPRHPYFGDPTDACYRGLPNAEDAAIVYRRLAEL